MSQITLKADDDVQIKALVASALQAEENELRTGILKTRQKLSAFERKYNLSTDAFLKASAATLPFGEMESIEWSGEWETLKRLEDKLSGLKKIKICS